MEIVYINLIFLPEGNKLRSCY